MAFPTGRTTSGLKSDKGGQNYAYRTGVQPNGTPSIGNWNTGGSIAGYGNSNGVYDQMGQRIGGQNTDPRLTGGPNVWNPPAWLQESLDNTVQSGPIPPALGPQGLPQPQLPMQPTQAPMGFAPPVSALLSGFRKNPFARYQTPAPSMLPRQYGPRAWDNEGQYGGGNPAMGFSLANFGNQGTWGGAQQTNIPKNPNGGGYTNINKNGGAGGMQFSYGGPR